MTAILTSLYVSTIILVGAFLFRAIERLEPNHRLAIVLKCAFLGSLPLWRSMMYHCSHGGSVWPCCSCSAGLRSSASGISLGSAVSLVTMGDQ